MKILIVNTTLGSGGAAIATKRLADEFSKRGLEIKYFVKRNSLKSSSFNVDTSVLKRRRVNSYYERIKRYLSIMGFQYYFEIASKLKFKSILRSYEPDIVFLNNLHGDFVDISIIRDIKGSTKIVWLLHDMWPITGHCSYSYDCDRWLRGCGECPKLEEYPRIAFDRTRSLLSRKVRFLDQDNISLVAPSFWLFRCLKSFNENYQLRSSVHHIANFHSSDLASDLDKKSAKSMLGLSEQDYVICFCAEQVSSYRKGFDLLEKVLGNFFLRYDKKLTAIIIGKGKVSIEHENFNAIHLGEIENTRVLSSVLKAGDLFCNCSRADNFPNVMVEAMLNKMTCITFNVGGCSELVLSGNYSITPFDIHAYSSQINKHFDSDYNAVNERAYHKILEICSSHRIVDNYIKIFEGKMNE